MIQRLFVERESGDECQAGGRDGDKTLVHSSPSVLTRC